MKNVFTVMLGASKRMTILAVFAGLITGVASMGMIVVLTRSVGDSAPTNAPLLFAGAALLVLLSGGVGANALVRVTQRSVDRLRLSLVSDLLSMSLRRFEKLGTGRAMALLTDDLATVGQAVQALPLLLVNAVIVVVAGAYIGYISLTAVLLIVAAGLVGSVAYAWSGRRASDYLRQGRAVQDDMHDSYAAVTFGMKDLKLDEDLREMIVSDNLRRQSSDHASLIIKGVTINLVTGYWGQLLFLACIGAVIFAGPQLGISGSEQLSVALAVLYLNTPLVTVLNILPNLSRASIALNRITEVPQTAMRRVLTSVPAQERVTEITLEDVVFGYDSEGEVFRVGPVSQCFKAGTVTILAGGNGSGKSTVGKVLAGLYISDEGAVKVNGEPLVSDTVGAYRKRVSACFTDSYVFPYVSAGHGADLQCQLERVGLSDLVQIEGHRLVFDGLSSGQRKRLILAQIMADPGDFVLLDEWAAEQDPSFRERFYHEILPSLRARGLIVVVISHDDRYFGVADMTVHLERGSQTGAFPAGVGSDFHQTLSIQGKEN